MDPTHTSPIPAPPATSAEDERPDVPDFEMLRLLGRGGFGEVWLGRSKVGVFRAVKLLPKDSGLTDVEFDGIRQYQTFARNHPNLIDVLHVGETPRHFYYVMDLADGYPVAPTFDSEHYEPRSLARDLELRGALGLNEAVKITREVLRGLQHLHKSGLLHRDVKPANVLFGQSAARLADVGLLTREDRHECNGGTPSYAPPEGVHDRSGDLYCLGRVLYEMVTGLPVQRFPEVPSDPRADAHKAYKRVAAIIDRACAPDPAGRFDHAEAFAAALDLAMGAPGASAAAPARRRSGRLIGLALIGVAAVILIWSLAKPPSVAPTSAARIAVLYKDSRESSQAYVLGPDRLPLRVGDIVRLDIELPEPAYPLVALTTATEGVQLVYPDVAELGAQQPVTRLGLPTDPGRWWNLSSPAAPLTFVLLVSPRPLDERAIQDAKRRLAAMQSPPTMDGQVMLRLSGGHVEPLRGMAGESRALDARRTVSSDPAFSLLHRVEEEFRADYWIVQALTVPLVEADGSQP